MGGFLSLNFTQFFLTTKDLNRVLQEEDTLLLSDERHNFIINQ